MTNTLWFEQVHLPCGIARIDAVDEMMLAVTQAVMRRKPVLVWGDPGVGKTAAAINAAKEFNAAFMTVSAANKSPEGLHLALLDAFHLYPMRRGRTHLGFELRSMLLGLDRPLIVDEFQNFEARTLRELMHFQEQCGFPLLAVGNASRISKVRAVDVQVYNQVETRWAKPVIKIRSPSEDDFRQIAALYRVIGAAAFDLVASFGAGRNLREVQEILALAGELKPVGPVTIDDISGVICGRYGVDSPSDLFLSKPISMREPIPGEALFRQQRKRV